MLHQWQINWWNKNKTNNHHCRIELITNKEVSVVSRDWLVGDLSLSNCPSSVLLSSWRVKSRRQQSFKQKLHSTHNYTLPLLLLESECTDRLRLTEHLLSIQPAISTAQRNTFGWGEALCEAVTHVLRHLSFGFPSADLHDDLDWDSHPVQVTGHPCAEWVRRHRRDQRIDLAGVRTTQNC